MTIPEEIDQLTKYLHEMNHKLTRLNSTDKQDELQKRQRILDRIAMLKLQLGSY